MKKGQKAFDFSVWVNGIRFHIRGTHPSPLENEQTDNKRPPHSHYTTEFQYFFNESRDTQILWNQKTYCPHAGQLCIIPPNIIHNTVSSWPITRFCFNMQLGYDAQEANGRFADYYRIQNVFSSMREIQIIEDLYISEQMNQFREMSKKSSFLHANVQKGLLLTEVILRAFDMLYLTGTPSSPIQEKQLNRQLADRKWTIEDHIGTCYYDENGISALAKQLHLSERQTRATVQELMGENYKKLITKQRMLIANNLIADSSIPLSDIAYQIGYHSYNGFYLAYLNYYGITPKEARVRICEKCEEIGEIDRKFYTEQPDPK